MKRDEFIDQCGTKKFFFNCTIFFIMLSNEETPSPLLQQTRSIQAGRPQSEVWKHFSKFQVKNSKGHYSAKCNYCTKSYNNKKEIEYYGSNLTEEEIRKVITSSEIGCDQGFDEMNENEDNNIYEKNSDDSNDEDEDDDEMENDDIDLGEPLLQISNIMDLNQEIFLGDNTNYFDESSESGSDQINLVQNLNYDPRQLVLNIISDDDETNHEGNNMYPNNVHPLFTFYLYFLHL
jgi:hypothetical protein